MKTGLRHLPQLDGLRGVAALYIFLHHFCQAIPAVRNASPLQRVFFQVAEHGYLAVDLFFVLSGFLITSLLLLDRKNPRFFHDFYWKRVLRIQPAFLLFLCVFWLTSAPYAHGYVPLCLLFIANFAPRFHIAIVSPAWTLCIEEQFYLVWPQIVRRHKTASIASLALGLFVFSNILRIAVLARHGGTDITYTFYRLDGLGLGALAACAFIDAQGLTRSMRRCISFLQSRTVLVLIVAGVLLTPLYESCRYSESISISLAGLCSYRLISAIAAGRPFKALTWRPLIFMGSISYGFYLYHAFVINAVVKRFGAPDLSHPGQVALRGALVFGGSIAASTASLYLIERPAQMLRRYVLRREPPLHAAAEPVAA